MPDVMNNFIKPLLTQFRIPPDKEADEDAFFQDYHDILTYCDKDGKLHHYDDDILKLAVAKLKSERTNRTFPLPSECLAVCRDIRNTEAAKRAKARVSGVLEQAKTDEARLSQRKAHPNTLCEWRSTPDGKPRIKGLGDEYWDERARKFADGQMKTPMGRQSVDEGWSWMFWDFCRENERLPGDKEVTVIRARSLANNAALDEFMATEEAAGRLQTPEMMKNIVWRRDTREKLRKLAYGA